MAGSLRLRRRLRLRGLLQRYVFLGYICIVLGSSCCIEDVLRVELGLVGDGLRRLLLLARAERLQVLVPHELTSGSGEPLNIDIVALVLVGQEGGQIRHIVYLLAHFEFL